MRKSRMVLCCLLLHSSCGNSFIQQRSCSDSCLSILSRKDTSQLKERLGQIKTSKNGLNSKRKSEESCDSDLLKKGNKSKKVETNVRKEIKLIEFIGMSEYEKYVSQLIIYYMMCYYMYENIWIEISKGLKLK